MQDRASALPGRESEGRRSRPVSPGARDAATASPPPTRRNSRRPQRGHPAWRLGTMHLPFGSPPTWGDGGAMEQPSMAGEGTQSSDDAARFILRQICQRPGTRLPSMKTRPVKEWIGGRFSWPRTGAVGHPPEGEGNWTRSLKSLLVFQRRTKTRRFPCTCAVLCPRCAWPSTACRCGAAFWTP
jgi:hypothetical protein